MEQEAVGYERDIRPLFREKDVSSMSMTFDLASYNDVHANAGKILAKLSDGSMPATALGQRSGSNSFLVGCTPAVRPEGGDHGVPG
jgi:hypothetical protein